MPGESGVNYSCVAVLVCCLAAWALLVGGIVAVWRLAA